MKVYYHGTILLKSNPNIDNFKSMVGYRSNPMLDITREVKSPWLFFTNDYDMAYKYGSSKINMYVDKGNNSYTVKVLKYTVDETKLNILDLTGSDYEFKLKEIGIDLVKEYGMYMYSQDMMWELLDNDEMSNIIFGAGYNGVKVLEDNGTSLAIYNRIVNDVIEKV